MTRRVLRPFRDWTVGAKLASTFLVVVAGVAGLVSVSVIRHERAALDDELRKRGISVVQNLARLSVDLVLQDDLWGLYKVVRDIASEPGGSENVVAYAMVLDPGGRVLAHSDPAGHPMGEALEADPSPASTAGVRTIQRPGGERIHEIAGPIVLDKQRIGVARVGITTRHLDATVARITRDILVVTTLLGALGVGLGFVISRRMTRPLRELGLAVDRIGEGRLEEARPVRIVEKDEIGRLADRFNVMARRLAENEARLIKSERLASVGELAGALAHEIRNPLGAVVAAAKMLAEQSPRAAGYDREALLRVVAEESGRLDRILTDFLAFARPRELARRPHVVNGLVREVLDSLRLDRLGQARRVDAALDPSVPPVPLDADQVKQVLWNVLRNAFEATQPGETLRVATLVQNGQVIVEVEDAGVGISPEQQARLFEPFQTSKAGGSGLGLAIAHRIVAAHGGAIDIESRPGAGTRVRIALPREAP